MGDHVDEFCPACGANIGPGTFDVIGCPVCYYQPDDFEFEDCDDDFHEEEFIEEDFDFDEDEDDSFSQLYVH